MQRRTLLKSPEYWPEKYHAEVEWARRLPRRSLGTAALLVPLCTFDALAQPDLDALASAQGHSEGFFFHDYVRRVFQVRVECGQGNQVALRPEIRDEVTLRSLSCAQSDNQPDPPTGFWLATRCLVQDVPEVDFEAWFSAALREEQQWVDQIQEAPCEQLTPADLTELDQVVTLRVQDRLLATGLFDYIVGAWRRHVLRRSDCFEREHNRLETLRSRLSSKDADCHDWKRLIRIEPRPGPDLARKIRLDAAESTDTKQAQVLHRLQSHGLIPCLAALLERDADPAVMDQLDFSGFGDSDAMTDYAWKVWSGDEALGWLDAAASSGRVPPRVRRELEKCGSAWPQAPTLGPTAGNRLYPRGRSPWLMAEISNSEARLGERHFTLKPLDDAFSVEVVERGGHLVADPQFTFPVNDRDLVCRPPPRAQIDPTPDRERDLVLTLRALEERTSIDLLREHRLAVGAVQRWLDEQPSQLQSSLSLDELRLIHREAQVRLFEYLRSAGALDYLQGAWRQHVRRESDWYTSARAELQASIADSSDDPFHCPPWEELLVATPHVIPDVSSSVVLIPAPEGSTSDPAIAALEQYGLSRCLGRILAERSEAWEIRELQIDRPSSHRASADHGRKLTFALDLWRKHGLNDWVHRTRAEQSVPADVASTITGCANGILPTIDDGDEDSP